MEQIKKLKKNRMLLFPNVTTGGYYDAMSQVIVYCSISRNDFENIIKDPLDLSMIHNTRLLVHEINHFLDHHATLHGQELFEATANAMNAIEAGTEKDYYHMIKLNKLARARTYEVFYKELSGIKQVGGNASDWKFGTTIGCRYDLNGVTDRTKPIILHNFVYRGDFIGRIPLSVESLWETSSMATEVTLHSQAMLKIEDKVMQNVESKIFVQGCSEWLYNSELLTYSTAAHLVSGLLNISDILAGLRLSKLLALISLNFPKEYVPLLKVNKHFTLPRETKKAILETNDPSYIFYRLVRNLQFSKEDVSSTDGEFDIEKILKINGLPTQKQFEERVIKSMQDIRNNHVDGPFSERMKASLEFGTSYFKDFGLNAYTVSPLHLIELAKKNALPMIFEASDLDDDKNIHVDRYMNISDIESRIETFIKACGY